MQTEIVANRLVGQPPIAPRLSEVLFRPSARGFDSIAPVPSNFRAIETAMLFSRGVVDFVALVGPSGWGKSHLLEAVATCVRDQCPHNNVEVLNASEWTLNQSRVDHQAPLLLDNVQDGLAKGRTRLQLRLALERRVRANRPTFLCFTAPKATRQLRSFLPSNRDWSIVAIDGPSPEEQELIVSHMAKVEGLNLSTALVRLLAHRVNGNGRTLMGALKRLKLHQAWWADSIMTLRGCGILNPFFADNSSWDLREHILEVARLFPPCEEGEARNELAIYAMLKIALLSEADVARFFEMQPARVYAASERFAERLKKCDKAGSKMASFVEVAVESLHICS